MQYAITICGFIGGWLLVAGPVWQAAIELREEQIDQEAIQAARSSTRPGPRVSKWWWLLPPVAYVKQVRQSKAARQAFHVALTPEQLEQTVNFLNKANGWLVVASGGFLLAVKETWEFIDLLHWPVWVFWALIVVMTILAISNAVRRVVNTHNVLNPDEPLGRKR
jgi:glyoxylate carboligase